MIDDYMGLPLILAMEIELDTGVSLGTPLGRSLAGRGFRKRKGIPTAPWRRKRSRYLPFGENDEQGDYHFLV